MPAKKKKKEKARNITVRKAFFYSMIVFSGVRKEPGTHAW
jgi:hypothetical protein